MNHVNFLHVHNYAYVLYSLSTVCEIVTLFSKRRVPMCVCNMLSFLLGSVLSKMVASCPRSLRPTRREVRKLREDECSLLDGTQRGQRLM